MMSLTVRLGNDEATLDKDGWHGHAPVVAALEDALREPPYSVADGDYYQWAAQRITATFRRAEVVSLDPPEEHPGRVY